MVKLDGLWQLGPHLGGPVAAEMMRLQSEFYIQHLPDTVVNNAHNNGLLEYEQFMNKFMTDNASEIRCVTVDCVPIYSAFDVVTVVTNKSINTVKNFVARAMDKGVEITTVKFDGRNGM